MTQMAPTRLVVAFGGPTPGGLQAVFSVTMLKYDTTSVSKERGRLSGMVCPSSAPSRSIAIRLSSACWRTASRLSWLSWAARHPLPDTCKARVNFLFLLAYWRNVPSC